MFLIDYFYRIVRAIFSFFSKPIEMDRNRQQIYVKWGTTTTVPVYLNYDWTVSDLKENLSKKVHVSPNDLRIIFAGKELHDDVMLQECDVGEQSIIHAVPSRSSPLQVTAKTKCPTNHTLLDAHLLEEDPKMTTQDQNSHLKKAHFFVYCSYPCRAMAPGKLRVRCATCKEGTLTVEKDPTCWDDVLTPGHIPGLCQAEGCNGNVAEFFFKCTKHITSPDDSAVALYLIKNNFKHIPCIACTDISPLIMVFPCADGHVICIECFQLYCTSCLNERRFIQDEMLGYTINCAAGCANSLIKEPHHFKLLGEDQYTRYQRFGTEECVLQAGGVLCPRPGCGAGLLPDLECRRVTCSPQGGSGCGYVFCRLCLQGYHIGPCESQQSCESTEGFGYAITDERAGSSRWDEDSKNMIQTTTKPCPKCRTPTERDGGCMHMLCTRSQCGFHWCWICQEEWTRECMGNHWFG